MKFLCLLIWCGSITSCASVKPPPDIPVFENLKQHMGKDPVTGHVVLRPSPTCVEKIGEFECGHGVYIMSGKEVYIGNNPKNFLGGKSWDDLKDESVMMPAVESYAPMSTWTINTCKAANCSDSVDAFRIKINSLNGIKGWLQNP